MQANKFHSKLLPKSHPEKQKQAKLVLNNLLSQNKIIKKTFDHTSAVMQHNPQIPTNLHKKLINQNFINSINTITEGMEQKNTAEVFSNNPKFISQAKAFKKTTTHLHKLIKKSRLLD